MLYPVQVERSQEPPWIKRTFVPLPQSKCQLPLWSCSELPLLFSHSGVIWGLTAQHRSSLCLSLAQQGLCSCLHQPCTSSAGANVHYNMFMTALGQCKWSNAWVQRFCVFLRGGDCSAKLFQSSHQYQICSYMVCHFNTMWEL